MRRFTCTIPAKLGWALLASLVVPLLSTPVAHAATGVGDEAERAISTGLERRRSGNNEGALPEFLRGYKLKPSPRAAGQLGLCYQALRRWTEGEKFLLEALAARTDTWVAKNKEILMGAVDQGADHIGRLDVSGDPVGAEVWIGGVKVGSLPLAQTVRMDEGVVDLELRVEGVVRALRSVPIVAGQQQRVVLHGQALPTKKEDVAFIPQERKTTPALDLTATPAPASAEKTWVHNPWVWVAIVGTVTVVATAVVLATRSTEYPMTTGPDLSGELR